MTRVACPLAQNRPDTRGRGAPRYFWPGGHPRDRSTVTVWRNFIGTMPCSLRPLPCGLNRQPSDQGVCISCHIPGVARLSGGALFLPAAARGYAVAFGSSPLLDNSLRRTGQRAPRPSGASDEAVLGRMTELARHHPRFEVIWPL